MSKRKEVQRVNKKLPLYLYTLTNSTDDGNASIDGKKIDGHEAKKNRINTGIRLKNDCSTYRRLRNIAPNTKHLISGYVRNVQFLLPNDNIYYNIPSFIASWLLLYYTVQRTLSIDVYHRQIADNINKPIRHVIRIQNGNNIKDLSNMMADIYETKSQCVLFYSNKNCVIGTKYDNKLLIEKVPHSKDHYISCYILKDWTQELPPKYFKQNNVSTVLCKVSHCTILSKLVEDERRNNALSANNWDFSVGNKFQVKDCKNGEWYIAAIKYHKKKYESIPRFYTNHFNDKGEDEEAVHIHFIGFDDKWDEWIFIENSVKCECSRKCVIKTHRIRPAIFESVCREFGKPFIISILNTSTNRDLYKIVYQRLFMWIGDTILKKSPYLLRHIKISTNGRSEYHSIGRSSIEIKKFETAWNELFNHLPFKLREIDINDDIFNNDIISIEWKENIYYKINDLMMEIVIDDEYREWKYKSNLKKQQEKPREDIRRRIEILQNLTRNWKVNGGDKIDIKDYSGCWYVGEIKKHFALNPLIKSTDTFIMNESIIVSKKNITMNDNNPLSTENILIDINILCECNKKCRNIKHRIAKLHTQSKYKQYGFIADKHGYLEKQSLYLKQFRTRWMVLKKNKLYSYKNINDNKTTEIFDLNIYDQIENSKKKKQCSKNCTFNELYQFQISSSNESKNGFIARQFIAASKEEMNEWIECIQRAQWTFDIVSVTQRPLAWFAIN